MFKHVTQSNIEVLPLTVVDELLEKNTYIGQRKLDLKTVLYYAGLMRAGGFHTPTAVLMFGPDGKEEIANGQHFLHAIKTNTVPMLMRVDRYACDGEEDKAALFSTFDSQKHRTNNDHVQSRRHCYSDNLGAIPTGFLSRCGSALHYVRDGVIRVRSGVSGRKEGEGADHIAKLLHNENPKLLVWLNQCRKSAGKPGKKTVELAILCAMITTWRSKKTKAEEFWGGVCSGTGERTGSIPFKLRDMLISGTLLADTDKAIAKGIAGQSGRTKLPYFYCLEAWERWLSGQRSLRGINLANYKEKAADDNKL